jgi:16S rRNA (cytidine1402-2'-O)-methyltransferase
VWVLRRQQAQRAPLAQQPVQMPVWQPVWKARAAACWCWAFLAILQGQDNSVRRTRCKPVHSRQSSWVQSQRFAYVAVPVSSRTIMEEKLEVALYVVATPIGNRGDITTRALELLAQVDVVAAEDTRNTLGLLQSYGISARLIAVHDHNERHAADGIVKLLSEGQSVALVSDAGTPGISDPGAIVVAAVSRAGYRVVPVAGVSAVIAAVSASGEGQGGFLFHGFLPTKTGDRRRALEEARQWCQRYPVVFYESPHRIVESISDMADVLGEAQEIVICRELTKKFETIQRLALGDAVAWLTSDPNQQRGELVLVLAKSSPNEQDESASANEQLTRTLTPLLAELPLKQAVQLAVAITGLKKNEVYSHALRLKGGGVVGGALDDAS